MLSSKYYIAVLRRLAWGALHPDKMKTISMGWKTKQAVPQGACQISHNCKDSETCPGDFLHKEMGNSCPIDQFCCLLETIKKHFSLTQDRKEEARSCRWKYGKRVFGNSLVLNNLVEENWWEPRHSIPWHTHRQTFNLPSYLFSSLIQAEICYWNQSGCTHPLLNLAPEPPLLTTG